MTSPQKNSVPNVESPNVSFAAGNPQATIKSSTPIANHGRLGNDGATRNGVNSKQYFSLRWNNYQSNITAVFQELLESQAFVDVTLACEDRFIRAHKVILSTCSHYFQRILMDNPCDHPTIILPPDVCFSDLQFIIEFVYRGEIDVCEDELQSLLRTADYLKIKGLCELSENREETNHFLSATLAGNWRTPHKRPGRTIGESSTSGYSSYTRSTHCTSRSLTGKRRRLSISEDILEIDLTEAEDLKTTRTSFEENSTVDLTTKNDRLTEKQENQQKTSKEASRGEKMTSLGMGIGMNGGLMSVPMGYLDFAPEPPAPSATPVTEHVDLNCNPTDTRDISSYAQPPENHHMHSEIRIKFETLRSLEAQAGMSVEEQGEHQNGHALPPMDNGAQNNETNGNGSPEEATGGQNVISNGSHHSAESLQECGSPEMQSNHQMPPTPITPNSNAQEVDLSRVKVEPEAMNVIVKQEAVSATPGETYNSDASEDSKMMSNGSRSITPNSQYGYSTNPDPLTLTNAEANRNNNSSGAKTWTQEDMDGALDALRNHNMSLTKASVTYGIPSTTLWQRAHRLGIDTPKKEGPTKSWSEEALNNALDALRTGTISANKASKAFGIPSSTLYKIARREGIRLAAPFNAAPTTWTQEDLERALDSIRAGQSSVQRASTEFGIPTGTLYGRCKREGIELSRSNPTPWSENAMMDALEAVRVGQMSINQAAIHYNLPYSSLYGRFKRGKFETPNENNSQVMEQSHSPDNSQQQQQLQQQQQQTQQISSQVQQQQQPLNHHLQYANTVQQQQQSPIQHAHHHQNHYGQQIIQNHTMAITIRNSVNPLDLQQQDVHQAMNVIQPHYLHTQPILQAHPLHHQFSTYPMERFEIKQEKN